MMSQNVTHVTVTVTQKDIKDSKIIMLYNMSLYVNLIDNI